MTNPIDIGVRRVRTDLHTSENFYLLSNNNSPRTLSPPNSIKKNNISLRKCPNTTSYYNYQQNQQRNNGINNYQHYQQYQQQSHKYIYSSSCPPAPSPLSSHLPARATRLLNRSRLQQQAQLGSIAGSDSPKSNDSFNLNRKQSSSSRASSIHLSNREINSSSDDLLLYDKSFRNSMIQDVLYFKKQLLRLRRILQEDEEYLQRTDTLNPFEVNNGQFFASPIHGIKTAGNQLNINQQTTNNICGSGNSISSNHSDLLAQQYCGSGSDNERNLGNSLQSLTSIDDPIQELADLRRQVVYLQGQVDDRERTIRFQKNLIDKLENDNETSRQTTLSPASDILEKEVVNTATQTERIRPLSIGQEGLSRSKPEYTSYTINLPNSGSSSTTTTTEIISPSGITGINFLNSNLNPSSRRHTVISTTFTNLNHNASNQPSTNNLINNNNNNASSPRRASIPWEKLIYKPVKTTLIGEPILSVTTTKTTTGITNTTSTINTNTTTTTTTIPTKITNTIINNNNNYNNHSNTNNNININNCKNYSIIPTVLKTTTTIISSQIDKNNKKNLLNGNNSRQTLNEDTEKLKISNNNSNNKNNVITNGKSSPQHHPTNLLTNKNSHSTCIFSSSNGNETISLNKLFKQNGEQKNYNKQENGIHQNGEQNCSIQQNGGQNYSLQQNGKNNIIDKLVNNNYNNHNHNNESNGIKYNSENHMNGSNSKFNNNKYNIIQNENNYNNSNKNKNCIDVIVKQTKNTNNNGSVTTIV